MFRSIGGLLTRPPALVAWGPYQNNLFALGVGADSALWVAQLNGFVDDGEPNAWLPWQSLGGVVMSEPCAVRTGESEVDVFALGQHSELLHWRFANDSWVPARHESTRVRSAGAADAVGPLSRSFESLGGTLTSRPHAVLFGEGDAILIVMARGTDHGLWVRSRAEGVWRDWDTLGHRLASPPHAAVWRKETLVAAALGTDSAIWYTTGAGWQSLGGQFSTAPYLISMDEHLYLFAVDAASHALLFRQWDGAAWDDWAGLDGILMSAPTANGALGLSNLVNVAGLGTDSAIWQRRNLGGFWEDWASLGGSFLSPPATLLRRADNGVIVTRDMVALGTDHAVWHLETDG